MVNMASVSVMFQALSQMILTDSDTFLLLLWFEAVVLLEAQFSSTLWQFMWNDVGRFPLFSFLPLLFSHLFHFWFRVFGRACGELINRDSAVLSLPRRDGNITQQRERLSQQRVSWRPGQAQTAWYCVKWMCKYYANALRAYHSFRWRISPLTPSVKLLRREKRVLLTAKLLWIKTGQKLMIYLFLERDMSGSSWDISLWVEVIDCHNYI